MATDVPLQNWSAPRTWAPAAAQASGERNALVTTTYPPLPFIPVTPCRVADTRTGSGFTGGYGPPSLVAFGTRNFTVGGQCGIPASAQAVSFEFTAVNITAAGNLRAYPNGVTPPTASILNWPATQGVIGNGIVVPLGAGVLDIYLNSASPVDLVIDVNGFYGPTPADQNQYFTLNNNSLGYTMYLTNASTSCGGPCGIFADVKSGIGIYGEAEGSTGQAGVFGFVTNTATDTAGVQGEDGTGLPGNGGVTGHITAAVRGDSKSSIGVYGLSNLLAGAFEGYDASGANISYAYAGTYANGLRAGISSTASDAAGITGTDGAGAGTGGAGSFYSAGARFYGKNGVIGFTSTTGGDGVVGVATSPATTGVIAFGNLSATGTKPFIEPHPTDASKEIRFVAMEGPEAGTYFRAKATVINGVAVIDVPDSFRMVTDPDGLTVHVTPVGRAQTWIESYDLNQIVVGSSKDVPVSVIVYGVRHAFKDWQVLGENQVYRPVSPDQTMPQWLSPDAKARLIGNGTYNADGTVNMRTAEQVGWAQQWRDEAAAQAKAAETSNVKSPTLPQTR